MYLKLLAFYTLKLKYLGLKNNATEDIILNTLSGLMSNLETGNKQFYQTLINLKSIVIETIHTYKKICKERNIKPQYIETNIKLTKNLNITDLIRLGEKEFSKKLKSINSKKRTIYEIIFLILKSICINLVELKSFNLDDECAYSEILYLLNTINFPDISERILRKKIQVAAKIDYRLNTLLYETRIKEYGEQSSSEVDYSTTQGKAILVAGTNLQELKKVLDATKDSDISIYTHGEMILAYTYPVFRNYKNLKGQFGKGIESCLLDFATFPGVILIAKHSLENIEYLYRGRLFTTDNFVPQGVIQIKNNDYSQLISSALSSRGFKTGKEREKVSIGCSNTYLETKLATLKNNIKKYHKIIILGTEEHTQEQHNYFKNLIANSTDDTFFISLGAKHFIKQGFHIKTAPDFYTIYRIVENLIPYTKIHNVKLSVFISKCDKHIVSNIINLRRIGVDSIFLSKCTPIMLNPILTNTLKEMYDIYPTSTPANDLILI